MATPPTRRCADFVGLTDRKDDAIAGYFVGFMMLVASLGKTEQTAAGAGWAILMPLSMLGGAMVPLFVMPQWMQTVGVACFAVGTRGDPSGTFLCRLHGMRILVPLALLTVWLPSQAAAQTVDACKVFSLEMARAIGGGIRQVHAGHDQDRARRAVPLKADLQFRLR